MLDENDLTEARRDPIREYIRDHIQQVKNDPLRVQKRLARANERLARAIEQQAQAPGGPAGEAGEHFVPDETDLEILQAYYEIGRAAVGADVADRVGVSRTAIASRIKALRQARLLHHRKHTRGDSLTDKGREALAPHID